MVSGVRNSLNKFLIREAHPSPLPSRIGLTSVFDSSYTGKLLFQGAAAYTHCAAAYMVSTAVYMAKVRMELSQLATKWKLKLKLSLTLHFSKV